MKKFLLLLTVMLGFAWQSNAQISWSYDESTATLTISGNGEIGDYGKKSPRPDWAKDAAAKNATTVIIEEGVTSVGEYAFYRMLKVTKVVIPNSVKVIENNAFNGCELLADIEWHSEGNWQITIASDAFFGIASNARVQYGIKLINYHLEPWKAAGLNCKLYYEWEHVYNANLDFGDNTDYKFTCKIEDGVFSIEGTGILGAMNYSNNYSGVIKNADKIVIGEGITVIGPYCFPAEDEAMNVTSIKLPSTLVSLSNSAFIGFSDVEELYIPAALTDIKYNSLTKFPNLSTIVVDDANPKYSDGGGCNAIICKDTKTLIRGCCGTTIPVGIVKIGEYAFRYSNISGELIIPEGVEKFYYGVFEDCKNLTGVILPASLRIITNDVFNRCSSLNTVTCLATTAPAITESPTYEEIKIETLYYPFGSDYSAWEGYFTTMKTLGGGSCGDKVQWQLVSNTLKIFGTGAMSDYVDEYPAWYEYADDITDVEIGEGVTSIGEYAFFEMSNVSNIVLPTTLETIGYGTFADIASGYTVTARSNAKNNDSWGKNATLVIDDNLGHNLLDNVNTFKSVVYNRTFGAGKVGTVVLPFELSDESKRKLTFYTLGETVGNYLVFEPVAVDDIKAGVPYIWENNTSSDVTKLTSVENATVAKVNDDADDDNGSGWRLVGTFDNKNIADKEELQTTYYLSAGKVMNATTSLSISPYRAYFEGPRYDDTFGGGKDASLGRKMFGIVLRGEEGDGTTVIENVTIDENGELNFDNATYDLSGRRVDENTKGIVIKNGKKVLVK